MRVKSRIFGKFDETSRTVSSTDRKNLKPLIPEFMSGMFLRRECIWPKMSVSRPTFTRLAKIVNLGNSDENSNKFSVKSFCNEGHNFKLLFSLYVILEMFPNKAAFCQKHSV